MRLGFGFCLIVCAASIIMSPARASPWSPGGRYGLATADYETSSDPDTGFTRRTVNLRAERPHKAVIWTNEMMVEEVTADPDYDATSAEIRSGLGVALRVHDVAVRFDAQSGVNLRSDILGTRRGPHGVLRLSVGRAWVRPSGKWIATVEAARVLRRVAGDDESKLDLTLGYERGPWQVYLQNFNATSADADWSSSKVKLTVAHPLTRHLTLALGVGQTVAGHNVPDEQFLNLGFWYRR